MKGSVLLHLPSGLSLTFPYPIEERNISQWLCSTVSKQHGCVFDGTCNNCIWQTYFQNKSEFLWYLKDV